MCASGRLTPPAVFFRVVEQTANAKETQHDDQ